MGGAAPKKAASRIPSDLVQIAALDECDEFVPFGAGEPDGVLVLTDPDALVADLDLRALVQCGH